MENQTLGSRIKAARTRAGLTQPELGKIFGVTREAVSLWESDKNAPTSDKIGRIALETHTSAEWLMTGRGEPEGDQPKMVTRPIGIDREPVRGKIPILGMAEGGHGEFQFNGVDPIDWIERPPFLANAAGAYAIYAVGMSMVPRYEQGEILFIHPGKPIQPNAFVVAQYYKDDGQDTPNVWIKQFLKRGPEITLFKQFNPEKTLKLETPRIRAVHRIVGTLES